MSALFDSDSTVVAIRDHVSADLFGEAAILHLKKGIYYGLDPVGARVWSLLQQPKRVNEIKRLLLQEYDVPPQALEKDLADLLADLLKERLIEVKGQSGS